MANQQSKHGALKSAIAISLSTSIFFMFSAAVFGSESKSIIIHHDSTLKRKEKHSGKALIVLIGEASAEQEVKGSLVLLLDTSGSMSGEKLQSAKFAAIETAKKAITRGIEISVIAFGGNCSSPVKIQSAFSKKISEVEKLLKGLSASGGTPLAPSLRSAGLHMQKHSSAPIDARFVVLLADGDNDDSCGSIRGALNSLAKSSNLVRHESVALEVSSGSLAAGQLKMISEATGGTFRAASGRVQLTAAFDSALDAIQVIELLGSFGGKGRQESPPPSGENKKLGITPSLMDGW